MNIGTRVIWRGAVYEVRETGTRFDEPWLFLVAIVNYTRDYGAHQWWVPAKHVRV
jgi:hypothetical protein